NSDSSSAAPAPMSFRGHVKVWARKSAAHLFQIVANFGKKLLSLVFLGLLFLGLFVVLRQLPPVRRQLDRQVARLQGDLKKAVGKITEIEELKKVVGAVEKLAESQSFMDLKHVVDRTENLTTQVQFENR